MVWFADATPLSVNPNIQGWHDLYKREAPEEEKETKSFGTKVKDALNPTHIKDETEELAKDLSKKTHIPTW